jgi:hypothetical protein
MAVLFFKLKNVPDDEAEDVRLLLHQQGIDFYETSAGNWGISMPAIWIRDELQLQQAKNLLSIYEVERAEQVKAEHETLLQAGQHKTILHSLIEQPVRFVVYLLLCAAIVYFSIVPFFALATK